MREGGEERYGELVVEKYVREVVVRWKERYSGGEKGEKKGDFRDVVDHGIYSLLATTIHEWKMVAGFYPLSLEMRRTGIDSSEGIFTIRA